MSDAQSATWWPASVLDSERWRSLAAPVVERLVTARQRDRLPHALLLIGPPGLGRELAAVAAAALLTCPNDGEPWCACASCHRVREGIHPDVIAVLPQGAAQQIRIDQVRRMVEAAPGRPFEGRCRVWIFDGVEAGRFGSEAANAFLKTLEEPPAHVQLLLLAANPEAVLATIRSRCQQLTLAGAVAAAHHLGALAGPPEMASLLLTGDNDVSGLLATAVAAIRTALAGETLDLIRLGHHLRDQQHAFELLAVAALQLLEEQQDQAEHLVRLADQALQTGLRARALNLNRGRQLLSCLLSWYQDRPGSTQK